MRDLIIIRISNSNDLEHSVSWVKIIGVNAAPIIENASMTEAVNAAVGAQVIVIVPGCDVLLTHVSIPTQNKQRLLSAVPFALEEELASDVENLHFAVGKADESGNTPVAVVEKSLMDRWHQLFKEYGLSVDFLIPDVLVIPYSDDDWTILLENHTALIRTDSTYGFCADVENLGVILPLTLNAAEEFGPKQISVWQKDDAHTITPLVSEEVDVRHHHNEQGLLGIVNRQSINFADSINLLQGSYSRSEQWGKLWRPWRFAASLAGAWFVMSLIVSVLQSSSLEAESAALKKEAIAIYKDTFPDAKKIVKPKAQMKQELIKLQSGGGKSRITFLNLLATSGSAFKKTAGLEIRSIRFKNGVLDVDLDVPNLQTLDQLKQKLTKNEELNVEILSAASRNNKVQGRLQIKGKAS